MLSGDHTVLLWCTSYNLWTFTWIVNFKLLFRLRGAEQIHTEENSYFLSILISVLIKCIILVPEISKYIVILSNVLFWSLGQDLPVFSESESRFIPNIFGSSRFQVDSSELVSDSRSTFSSTMHFISWYFLFLYR